MDLLLARRLLSRFDHGAPARRGDGPPLHSHGFSQAQLRLQAFDAPASWAHDTSSAGDGDNASPDPCAVCLEHVAPGERCVSGPACLHRLHEACALQLVAHAGPLVCPTCRAPLLAVDCRAPGEAGGSSSGSSDCGDGDAPSNAPEDVDLHDLHALLMQAAQSASRRLLWRSMHGGVGGVMFGDSDDEDDAVDAEERAAVRCHARATCFAAVLVSC